MKITLTTFDSTKIDDILSLWNRSLPLDTITKQALISNHLCDLNFDPELFLLAYDQNILIGFLYAIQKKFPDFNFNRHADTTWIQVIAIDTKYRRSSIGKKLMEALLNKLNQSNCTRIVAGKYSPSYLFPGIDDAHYPSALTFFRQFGFVETGLSYGMSMDLRSYVYPDAVLQKKASLQQKDYLFQPLDDASLSGLHHLLASEFKTSWLNTILKLIRNGSYPNTIQIACLHNEVVGFTSISGIDGDLNRFGPFGIHPEHRNQGLGEVLFHETMKSMSDQGSTYAYFKSTDAEACRFYKRQGMVVDRIFIEMEKRIIED